MTRSSMPPPPDNVVPFSKDLPTRVKTPDNTGEPPGGDMEQKVAALEGRMSRVEDKLDRIAETVARIEGKLDAKVDYKWALAITTAIILVILRAEIMAAFAG